jgi:prophage regulatory protein
MSVQPDRPRFVRIPIVEDMTSLSRGHIYKLIAEGEFPRPVRIGKRAAGWLESDVVEWVTARPRTDAPGAQRPSPALAKRAGSRPTRSRPRALAARPAVE